MKRENAIVAYLVYRELAKHKQTEEDKCVILHILVDDNGNCIHITIADKNFESSWLYTDTIKAIGRIFGDNNPAVTTENNSIKLIIVNTKCKEIMTNE